MIYKNNNFLKKKMQSFIKQIFKKEVIQKPLGRWCHCGEKNKIDVILLKDELKKKRMEMKKKNLDPYELLGKTDSYKEEEYMIPFVFSI